MKLAIILITVFSSTFLVGSIINSASKEKKHLVEKKEPPCRFEGAYILQPGGAAFPFGLDMAIPLDSRNERVAIIHDLANYDATLGGLFPTATRLTTGQGEGIRTGPRTFSYTIHFWALDKDNRRVALIISNGTKFFNGTDCNKYEVPEGTLSVYTPDQDSDNDGYPDPDQKPKFCLPLICKAKRIDAQPPCRLSIAL